MVDRAYIMDLILNAPSLAGGSACPWRAGSASRPAFPGGALALQGVEDHVVDDGAVGAAQGH